MYHVFTSFFVRVPCFPYTSLEKESFKTKILNQQVREAIYIASPILYTEMQKYIAGSIKDLDEKQRIESSVYRYINRMSSRCTPFGLFAGCSIGSLGEETGIVLKETNRCTRLDMYFLCTLSQELSKLPEIKEKVRYYPNTALYPVGKKYRYIEYQYTKSSRIHRISSVDRSVYLDTILKIARKGAKVKELSNYLIKNEIDPDDAKRFIEELIDSQIIVSELSPSVTGDDYFTQIIRILEELNVNEVLLSSLKEIQETLCQLDAPHPFLPSPKWRGVGGEDLFRPRLQRRPLNNPNPHSPLRPDIPATARRNARPRPRHKPATKIIPRITPRI